LLFLVLEGISLAMLVSHNSYHGSVYLTSANHVTGKVYEWESELTSYLSLKEVNRQLVSDNVEMRLRLASLERALDSLRKDSVRIDFVAPEYHLVHAQVVKATLHRNNNYLTIDKGRRDGIRPEMAVISSGGVVGIVYLTSDHYSIVIPLLNVRSSVSCKARNSKYFGTLQWQRGAVNIAYVIDVPRHANVHKGEVVETNGYSEVFPAGIPIGKILDVGDSPDGLSFMLKVQLFTDFSTLRDVSVITNYSREEKKLLEQKADSSDINH
jgi:rod shape-determining protein MreC